MRAAKHHVAHAGLLFAGLLLAAGAWAETQRLDFPSAPRWYFVSLQVDPLDPAPEQVFPLGGGFAYDHLWSYDPVDGWRHFSPLPELATFNDLTEVEALRGYWIHVTKVPPGGLELAVDGARATRLALVGAEWHPIGALTPPGAVGRNVASVFQTVSGVLTDKITELWSYRADTGSFLSISAASYQADCAVSPELCLAPGAGYWLRTTGDFEAGQTFRVSSSGILLSADQPLQRVEVSYEGAGSAVGTLAPPVTAGGTPLRWVTAVPSYLEEEVLWEADLAAPVPSGPDTQADVGNDGTIDPCPDICTGEPDCLNLCFANDSQTMTAFLWIPPEDHSQLGFTTLEPGRAFTDLELFIDDGTGLVGFGPRSGRLQATVPVAIKPPAVVGTYDGILIYDEDSQGVLPIRMLIDDRAVVGGQQTTGTGQATAVLNPQLAGSDANGVDDDGDTEVDEADENGGVFQVRNAPGFPSQTILRGSVLGSFLRLEGETTFAGDGTTGTCISGSCSDGTGRCLVDADCPRDAGMLGTLDRSGTPPTRTLRLDGQRTDDPLTFSGTFIDSIERFSLLGDEALGGRGTFILTRVESAQCVVRDAPAPRSLPLGISCEVDADCPFRCTGGVGAGLGCSPGDPNLPQGCACAPYPCRYRELADLGAAALEYEPLDQTLALSGSYQGPIVVEVLGLDGGVQVIDWPSQSAAGFGLVPCGATGELFTVRATAYCDGGAVVATQTTSALCTSGTLDLGACDGPAAMAQGDATSLANGPTVLSGRFSLVGAGPISIAGGVATAGPPVQQDAGGTVRLFALGGIEAVLGRDAETTWTDELAWPGFAFRVLAGPLGWLTEGL